MYRENYHNDIPDPLSWTQEKIYLKGYPFDPDATYVNKENLDIQAKNKESFLKKGKAGYTYVWYDRFGYFYTKAKTTEIGDVPDNGYYDGAQTDMAIKRLRELNNREKPFFFAIGYYRPHLPFNAPKKYWDLYNREEIPLASNSFLPKDSPITAINNLRELRGYTDMKTTKHPLDGQVSRKDALRLKHGYYACVSYIDAQIGRLIKELDRLKIRDKTIIVLWGDHGWKLGEHASWCKMTNYEIDTRAPLIISSPVTLGKNIKCHGLVEFVDIYPTLCDLAGLSIPGNLEGISMLPLFKNPKQPWKKAVFSQFLREGIWIAPDGKEYMGYSIRTGRYRYVEWINWKTKKFAASELYDHETDPQENVNIVNSPQLKELVQQLSRQLKNGWKAALPQNKK
jgi:arylsulfatase A-like enzyme